MEARHAVEIDRKTPLGVLSFVSAVLSLALLVASLRPPPSAAPADLLAYASSHRALYGLFASLVLAWSVFSGGVAKCRVPNWVAVVGMVGGVTGLLTLAVYQTPALALVQLFCFTIWGFAAGVTLLRAR